MGKTGAGAVEHWQIDPRTLIQVGTLSKAVGSLGGYVAGAATVIDFLANRCASWIYTTALSPADTAAAIAGVHIIRTEPTRRDRLWQNIEYLKKSLVDLPLGRLLPSQSAILCWELPSVTAALDIASELRERGIFAPAIRPPTVPTSRIRLTVMADHTLEDLAYLSNCLQALSINSLHS